MKIKYTDDLMFCDIETESLLNIKKTSTYLYAIDSSTKTLIFRYVFNKEKTVHEWFPLLDKCPDNLKNFKGLIVAHNFWFEFYNFLRMIKLKQLPTHFSDIGRYRCTMNLAYMSGLPGKLEDLSYVLQLKNQKQTEEGERLIDTYSKRYQKKSKFLFEVNEQGSGFLYRKDIESFSEYCKADVLAEREIYYMLPKPDVFEAEVFEMDKIKNYRGVNIDLKQVEFLLASYEKAEKTLFDYAAKKYGKTASGKLKIKSDKEIKNVFSEHNVYIDNGQKETLQNIYDNTKDKNVKTLIDIRFALKATNLKKLYQMRSLADENGIIRNTTQYHYDITSRDAGRGIQPQSMWNKPLKGITQKELLNKIKTDCTSKKLAEVVQIPGLITLALRSCIVAPKGEILVIADFSTIEPRVLFWFAGAKNGLKAFEQGLDIYNWFAAIKCRKKIKDVIKEERQLYGKTPILAFGYGQGEKAAAEKYKISVELAAELKSTYFKVLPEVKRFHHAVWDQLIQAVKYNKPFKSDKYSIEANNTRIKITLPSGHPLILFKPRFLNGDLTFRDKKGIVYLWFGRIVNYLVQGTARDIMKRASVLAEKEGYKIVLEIHDEIAARMKDEGVAKNKKKFEKFIKIMESRPSWFGLEIKAAGEISKHYKKI